MALRLHALTHQATEHDRAIGGLSEGFPYAGSNSNLNSRIGEVPRLDR